MNAGTYATTGAAVQHHDISPHHAAVKARIARLAEGPLSNEKLLQMSDQLHKYGWYLAADVHRMAVCERLIRKEEDDDGAD